MTNLKELKYSTLVEQTRLGLRTVTDFDNIIAAKEAELGNAGFMDWRDGIDDMVIPEMRVPDPLFTRHYLRDGERFDPDSVYDPYTFNVVNPEMAKEQDDAR